METQAPSIASTAGNGSRWKFSLRDYFPILLLVALIIAFASQSSRFLTFTNFSIVLQQTVVLLVAALGMTFVIIAGSIDLSVGSIVAIAALVAASLSESMGIWAIIPAVLVGTFAGLLNGVIFAKGKVPSFMVTLGTLVAYRGIVLYFTRGAPVEITNLTFLRTYSGRTADIPNAAIITFFVVLIAYVIYNHTVFGREVRAVGGGERVSLLTGIKVDRVKIMVFVISGLLCGLAGLLQSARVYAATAQLGEGLELDVIAAVVVGGTPLTGGVGGITGTVLGAFIITILSNGMNMLGVDPFIQNMVKGVVLVAAVFVTIDRSKIGIIK
ncbi:MAG: ABC transporter permease [Anaerolineae bacterium]|nr:ABC transporter permease [Anaerolineae bacterium]